MSGDIEVKEVVIKINKKEISLTIDEVKKLQKALAELVGSEKTVIREVVRERPYWFWDYRTAPIWTSGDSSYKFSGTTIECNVGEAVCSAGDSNKIT